MGRVLTIFMLSFAVLIQTEISRGQEILTDSMELDTLSVKKPVKTLFTNDSMIHITLKVEDMKTMIRDNGEDPGWHNGILSYRDASGKMIELDVKLQPRGHYRKDPANCQFPPIRLNFKKNSVDSTLFEGQDKLKLVTHCNNRAEYFEQYVLKEYLAYRIYNILTERSLRVRLARITYTDQKGRFSDISRYGFFIEDTRDMAERNGFTHIKVNNIPQEYTDFFYQDLVAVFQYMIGNTDWSVPARHNIKLLMERPGLKPVPVPYDFDWTGLVNPVYAKPSKKLGIQSVEERLFRGYEKNIEDYYRIFDLFHQHKDEIYALIEECPLDDRHRKSTESYIQEFYAILSDERRMKREFIEKARTPNADYWGK